MALSWPCAISEAAASAASSVATLFHAPRQILDKSAEGHRYRDSIADAARRFAGEAVLGGRRQRAQPGGRRGRSGSSSASLKSIACDATEDKKHIDLSSEPLIIVCAAGLREHRRRRRQGDRDLPLPQGNTDRRRRRGRHAAASAATISVPHVDPALGFILSAMVGHIFGYEAALAIDASAAAPRGREAIERAVATGSDSDEMLATIAASLPPMVDQYLDALRDGYYNGHLEASTAVRLSGLPAT